MKIKRFGIVNLSNVINSLYSGNFNIDFSYFLVKNKTIINDEMTAINKIEKSLIDYNEKRNKLCTQYCNKNDKGEPVIENNMYQGLTNNEDFNAAAKKLQDENEEYKAYVKFMNEEVDINFFNIDKGKLPKEISPIFLEIFFSLIDKDAKK